MYITHSKLTALAKENTQMGPYLLSIGKNYHIQLKNTETDKVIFGHDTWIHDDDTFKIICEELETLFNNAYFRISRNNMYTATVDLLYNHYVEKYFFGKNNKIKQSTINEVLRRYDNLGNYNPYSNILINRILALGHELQVEPFTVIIDGESYKCFNIYKCYVNGSYREFPLELPPTHFGYIKLEGNYYVTPDRLYIDEEGNRYDTVNLMLCDACGKRVPHLYGGDCKACLGVDPKLLVVHNYNERAPDHFKYKTGKYSKGLYGDKPLYLGIEIEYQVDDREKGLLHTVRKLQGHALCKRDGSISDGFEIVTTPATFDEHVKVFKPFFETLPNCMKSHRTTGMHVHVSRAPLNFLTQGKLVEFMNRDSNIKFIESIAGRPANSYTAFDHSRTISFPFLNHEAGRYNTLNINNRHTLEFRIFATPTTLQTFLQRLDFVQALVAYCSPCQSKAKILKDVTHHTEFVKYVIEHKKDYPYFFKFLDIKESKDRQVKYENYKLKSVLKSDLLGAI